MLRQNRLIHAFLLIGQIAKNKQTQQVYDRLFTYNVQLGIRHFALLTTAAQAAAQLMVTNCDPFLRFHLFWIQLCSAGDLEISRKEGNYATRTRSIHSFYTLLF